MNVRPRSLFLSLLFFSVLSLVLLLGGCGSQSSGTAPSPVPTPAPAITIQANPAPISAGKSSALTITVTHATQVSLSGSDGSSYTLPAGGGTQAVTPPGTTSYSVTAVGSGGRTTAQATVTVTPLASAPTVGITASPASIPAGASSTLTVAAADASTVTVTGSDGSSYTLPANGGTQAVTPAATTTYTVVAVGSGGKTTAATTVTVTLAPTVTLSADPASIPAGGSSNLTVAATHTSTVTIAGSDGSSYTLPASGGTQAVTPKATTTYTATAAGDGGKAAATAMVTVTPAPTVGISAHLGSISEGDSSTLTIVAANATDVTVTGTDGSSYSLTPTGGTEVVSPSATTTYTATASSGGVKVTATAIVTVGAAAPAALVYVSTAPSIPGGDPSIPPAIVAYSAAADGHLTQVGSSPLADGERMAAVSGKSLITIDPSFVHAYAIDASGAVGSQASQIDTRNYGGAECGTATGASVLDRSGSFLSVELYTILEDATAPCDGWQTYQVSPSGQLTFIGEVQNTDQQNYHDIALGLGISTDSAYNQFAYGILNDLYASEFTGFKRTSAGDLAWNPGFSEVDPAVGPDGQNFYPRIMASDDSNHLAVVMWQAFAPSSTYLFNFWLASYTIDPATGAIRSTNTYATMPHLTVTSVTTMAMSLSGKFVAVGSGAEQTAIPGLQILNFNGADPATSYGNLLLPNVLVSQVAWDENDHLYVLGDAVDDASGQLSLHVYTVTADSITETTGSPVSVPNACQLIVVPKP